MEIVISGGQSGADLAGIDWALQKGIPAVIHTFVGFKPIYRQGLGGYHVSYLIPPNGTYTEKLKHRTRINVVEGDGTLVFIDKHLNQSRGSLLTVKLCQKLGKPYMVVPLDLTDAKELVIREAFKVMKESRILNIAGSRTCKEEKVRELLGEIHGYR